MSPGCPLMRVAFVGVAVGVAPAAASEGGGLDFHHDFGAPLGPAGLHASPFESVRLRPIETPAPAPPETDERLRFVLTPVGSSASDDLAGGAPIAQTPFLQASRLPEPPEPGTYRWSRGRFTFTFALPTDREDERSLLLRRELDARAENGSLGLGVSIGTCQSR